MMLMRVCFELNALCNRLASCGAINEIPRVYLALHWSHVIVSTSWYLGFPYFLRDLVRLQLHVGL